MKKIIAAAAAFSLTLGTMGQTFAAVLPGHRGTDMSQFEIGTTPLSSQVTQYNDIFKGAGDQFGVDPNLLAAICMQESGGKNWRYRDDGSELPAWGIMQIQYTNEKSFAKFGLDYTGEEWTLEDRLDPEKSVMFAAYLLSETMYKYECDYAKMIQAYNFGEGVVNRLIEINGDNWLNERGYAAWYATMNYRDEIDTEGLTEEELAELKAEMDEKYYKKYGDMNYIEHVVRYYHNDMEYIGAMVRINEKLVRFDSQHPIIQDGRTLIPIRAVSEMLGAKVDWDGDAQCAIVKKNGKTIKMYIDDTTAYVNGSERELDCPAQLINNRTLVPLRFVAEALGVNVEWDGDARTVMITY